MKSIHLRNTLALLIVYFCMNLGLMAQSADTAYRNTLLQMVERGLAGSTTNSDQLKKATVSMLKAKNLSDEQTEKLAEEYITTQFKDDIVDLLLPYYEPYVSISDMQFLMTQLDSEAGRRAMQANAKVTEAMSNEQMGALLQEAMIKTISGQTPTDIPAVECPESYRKSFQRFWDIQQLDTIMTLSMSGIDEMLSNPMATPEQQAQIKEMMNKVILFLKKNMKTWMLNSYYGNIEEADLDFYTKVYSTPAGQNMGKANLDLSKNAIKMGTAYLSKINTWVNQKTQ